MALARREEFAQREKVLADFAKALSHPARIAILTALAEKKECICGELVMDLPLAQSTVSQHLKALKETGLIKGTVDGPRSLYCINWKTFAQYELLMGEWVERMAKFRQENRC